MEVKEIKKEDLLKGIKAIEEIKKNLWIVTIVAIVIGIVIVVGIIALISNCEQQKEKNINTEVTMSESTKPLNTLEQQQKEKNINTEVTRSELTKIIHTLEQNKLQKLENMGLVGFEITMKKCENSTWKVVCNQVAVQEMEIGSMVIKQWDLSLKKLDSFCDCIESKPKSPYSGEANPCLKYKCGENYRVIVRWLVHDVWQHGYPSRDHTFLRQAR